ncbi:hypothetical protein DH2020_024735 [Rehmannia glutinosa]|uniref:Retrovirus-related Pol polyprotein from transposon TNT 1-94 n=1 Tax=Rehmannia glutinosa TaxID=99300 RepID=A0ABR0W5Y6_REHGL
MGTPQVLTAATSAAEQIIQLQSQLITIKLNESNHLLWKQQVLAAIRGYGLERFITEPQEIPAEFIADISTKVKVINPAYLLWCRQDQLLVSWLLSSLSESVLISTVGLTTSKEICDCLQTGFASQNDAKILQYRLQLQTIRKENLSMRDYLNKIKNCCDLLGSAGEKVSERDHLLYILSGLGQEYNPVLVSLTTRKPPCTLMDAYSILMSFENRLEVSENFSNGAKNGSFSVNLITQGQGNRRNNNNSQGGRGS